MTGNLNNQDGLPENRIPLDRVSSGEGRLHELVDLVIEDSIDEPQFQELLAMLRTDPEARACYVRALEVETMLRQRSPDEVPDSQLLTAPLCPATGIANSSSVGWGRIGLACSLALAVFLCCLGYRFLQEARKVHGESAELPAKTIYESSTSEAVSSKLVASRPASPVVLHQSVARITNGQDLRWKGARELSIGSWLKPGIYELVAGNLELTFDSGAVVFVAPESKFELIGANEVRLLLGSLEANVPEQAIGFKVQTPSGEITDLSTKFGVRVSKSGESDVHVLQGLVEAQPVGFPLGQLLTVKENSAIRMFPAAPPEPVDFSPDRLFEFGSRNNQRELNYLHFSFDEEEIAEGIISNGGPGGAGLGGKITDGRAANSWVQVAGVFGKSLFFSGAGAKIETPIKGIEGNQPRTLSFWVRINPKTPISGAYSFASWGHPGDAEGRRWQIGWNPNYLLPKYQGVMGAVRTEFGLGYVIGSTDLRDGRWHHIASVFLGGNQGGNVATRVRQGDNVATRVRHYVDGKLESVSGYRNREINTQSNQRTLTIGDYLGGGQEMFSGYKGWIDEFYLFDEALTPSQIVRLMEHNQPPEAGEIVVGRDAG